MSLEIINGHPRDDRIKFYEKNHIYEIDGSSVGIVSSTTLIHHYFGSFDADGIIKNIIKSKKWSTDETYKYYKMKSTDIKKEWENNSKNASEKGTRFHGMVELFYNDHEIEVLEDDQDFEYFLNFYQENEDMKIYRTEWFIFADDLKIAGSIDATFINEDGTLTLVDWKRSKEIKYDSFGGKKAVAPFNHMPDCNYSQYSLQLNLYRAILENYYGYKVTDMFLVVCHPDNDNFIKINVPRLDEETTNLLEDRRKKMM